jgi:hypothetical protein
MNRGGEERRKTATAHPKKEEIRKVGCASLPSSDGASSAFFCFDRKQNSVLPSKNGK